ncbi:MAG: hypothetical protein IT437_01940 [Phycisphaerales bacterium]|nr:hypothetical protein [Phycisphaerales bacterium]
MQFSACVAIFILSGAALAQDQPPLPITPEIVLGDLRAAYRKAPVADEVRVTLRTPAGPVRSDRVVIRADAAGVRTDDGPRSVLLTLGPLSIWVGGGRVVATHEAEPGAAFVREFTGPIEPAALRDILPPIPLPQLAALAPDAAAMSDPTPYTPHVTWTGASLDTEAKPPTATVTGSFPGGPVTMTIDAQSGRLTSFRADTTGPDGPVTLELTSKPIDPGTPASWKIDAAEGGREVVTSLAELRTGRVPPVLRAGDTVPDVALLGPDLSAWSLHDALASAARERPGEPAAPAVLILFRAERVGPAPMNNARTAAAALRVLATAQPPTRFISRAGVVIDLGEFSRDRFQALRRQWAEGAPPDSDGLLWASSAAQTIDRFSREAAAIAAIIGPDRTLRAVIVLDANPDIPAAISAVLAPPPPPSPGPSTG